MRKQENPICFIYEKQRKIPIQGMKQFSESVTGEAGV